MVPFVLLLLVSVTVALVLPPIYRSYAVILIENQEIPQDMVPSTVTSFAEQRIQTITQMIMSRSRILELVEKYDLFPGKRDEISTDILVDKVRDRIQLQPINTEVHNEQSNRPVVMAIAFELSFLDEDPKKAQAVANEVSSFYMEMNLEKREKNAAGTTTFLKEQSKELGASIAELEGEIAAFRKEHLEELPEFTTLNMSKMEKLHSDISNLNMQIRSMEEQYSTLRSRIAALDPYAGSEAVMSTSDRLLQVQLQHAQVMAKYSKKHPEVLRLEKELELLREKAAGETDLRLLRERLEHLELVLADMRSRYSNEHPSIKSLSREIEQLREEIRQAELSGEKNTVPPIEEASNPVYIAMKTDMEKAEVSVRLLREEKAVLEKQLEEVYSKLQAMPEVSKDYNELLADYEAAKTHYKEIQYKLLTARVSLGMEEEQLGERFTVVEPAFLPERPNKPNRIAILLIGLVLSVGLGVAVAGGTEFIDDRVHDSEDLEMVAEVPLLATIHNMVTLEQRQRKRKRTYILIGATGVSIVAGLIAFHYLVMDFYVFFAKLDHFLQSRFPI